MGNRPDELRLGVVGFARSGTTLVQVIIQKYFYYALGEALLPVDHRTLTEVNLNKVPRLYMRPHPAVPQEQIQKREERLNLLKKYSHQPYCMKIFGYDLAHPGVIDWLHQVDYKLIAVERGDLFDAVLSGLIALQHNHWNTVGSQPIPSYQPFTVSRKDFIGVITGILEYKKYKPKIEDLIVTTIYYEDFTQAKTCTEIIQAAKLPELFGYRIVDDRPLPTKKLLRKIEKLSLIQNINEVREWCREFGIYE